MISSDDPELVRDREQLMEDGLWPLLMRLRQGIWHVTSPVGFLGIQTAGRIKISHARGRHTFPQTRNSYGKFKRAVCLFDFASADLNGCIECYWKWWTFFCRSPFAVALELDRDALAPRLIPNNRAREEVGVHKVWIPWVEAWHRGPIPASAIKSYLVIPYSRAEWFEIAPVGSEYDGLVALARVISQAPGAEA